MLARSSRNATQGPTAGSCRSQAPEPAGRGARSARRRLCQLHGGCGRLRGTLYGGRSQRRTNDNGQGRQGRCALAAGARSAAGAHPVACACCARVPPFSLSGRFGVHACRHAHWATPITQRPWSSDYYSRRLSEQHSMVFDRGTALPHCRTAALPHPPATPLHTHSSVPELVVAGRMGGGAGRVPNFATPPLSRCWRCNRHRPPACPPARPAPSSAARRHAAAIVLAADAHDAISDATARSQHAAAQRQPAAPDEFTVWRNVQSK